MKENKTIRRILPTGVLGALLLLAPVAPLAFTACDTTQPEINITMESNFSGIVDKLSAIESALNKGFTDSQSAQEMIRKAIETMGGTLADKLSAIESAVKSQTMSLETKLALIEAAVKNGLADTKAQQELLKSAIESLAGTLEEKIAAIETAVKAQTTSLETKLDLIETAVENGLADSNAKQELLQTAIESLGGTLAEKFEAVEEAIKGQTTSLETKLDLIETAVTNGLADSSAKQELLQTAIESLDGTLAEKLAAVEEAIKGQTTSLETKLDLIETAVTNGLASGEAKQELLKEAIESLSGSMEKKLAAIEQAVKNQTTSLESKLSAIQTAVKNGFTDEKTALGLIKDALNSLKGAIDGDTGLIKKIDEIVFALGTIDTTLNDQVAKALTDIFSAINGLTDYSEILTAIKEAIENLGPQEINGHTYVCLGPIVIDGVEKKIKWATTNLGAEKPEEYGDYFDWGATVPYYQEGYSQENPCTHWIAGKSGYSWGNYSFMLDGYDDWRHITKYTYPDKTMDAIWYEGENYIGDNKSSFADYDYVDDAARNNWGGSWRVPTHAELTWLRQNCTWTWTDNYQGKGVKGMIVTSNVAGFETNSIFLPAGGNRFSNYIEDPDCGCYWSSTTSPHNVFFSAAVVFSSEELSGYFSARCFGRLVRPVSD